ncbi:unnamed protein product, partial [Mesorhabditis spiculigera]
MTDDVRPDDYEGHYFDPGEATSSTVFVLIGLISLVVFLRIARYHYRHGFESHFQKIFLVFTANTGVFPGVVSWLSEYSILLQMLGTLLTALNRATALAFPTKYMNIWGPYTWHYIGITALIPFIYRAPSFTATSHFLRLGWGYYIPYTIENGEFAVLIKEAYYPACGITIFLTLLVNTYTSVKLFSYTKKLKQRELVNTIALICVNTMDLDNNYVIFFLQPIFADIANFLPLWFLLLISEETRAMVSGKLARDAKPISGIFLTSIGTKHELDKRRGSQFSTTTVNKL